MDLFEQEYVPTNQVMQGGSPVTYDEYESLIMSLMRKDRAKTYTVEQIRVEIIGDRLTLQKKGHNPLHIGRRYEMVDEALDRLVKKGKVYRKEDGSGKVVYGIKTSYAQRVRLLVDKLGAWWARRRVRLDRRVKRIHRNWLALLIMAVGIVTALIIPLLWSLDI